MTLTALVLALCLCFCSCDNVFSGDGSSSGGKKPPIVPPPPYEEPVKAYRVTTRADYTVIQGSASKSEEVFYVYVDNRLSEIRCPWEEGYYFREFYYYDSLGYLEKKSKVYEIEPDAVHFYYYYDSSGRLSRQEQYNYSMSRVKSLVWTYNDTAVTCNTYNSRHAGLLRKYLYGQPGQLIRYENYYQGELANFRVYVYQLDGKLYKVQYYKTDEDLLLYDVYSYGETGLLIV